jgi:hypothetical protein
MTIRIVGYDIVALSQDEEGNVTKFNGVAHLDANQEAVDMPFEGSKLKEQLGFNEFFFKDPDEVRLSGVVEHAGEIRDRLTEYLLSQELATGEFEAHIVVQ